MKWVGGKRQLLSPLLTAAPRHYAAYHEPFIGGGALFFGLLAQREPSAPPRAWLSDTNERLIRTYRGVRDCVDRVVATLRTYPHDRDFFLRLRSWNIDDAEDAEVAAWFIYLNKTGYNGLYRVNGRNVFNVPFGRYHAPTICDEPNLRACARALQGVELRHEDFAQVGTRAAAGDLVYFDPPYVPVSATADFTSYTAAGFDLEDQRRLRDLARALKGRGVQVVLSNSDTPLVRELYGEGFEILSVRATRAVNSRAQRRGAVGEVIIR